MPQPDALSARPANGRATRRRGDRKAFQAYVKSGVVILAGPTASGKTDVAIALAQEYDGEIVGADSRQIYRGMPIGTAAPTDAQLRSVRHHLVGFLDPRERYSAAMFVRDALEA